MQGSGPRRLMMMHGALTPPRDGGVRDAFAFDVATTEAGNPEWSNAGTCNDLISTSPFLAAVRVAQPLPPMTGGPIEPGTYELTKLEFYDGADGGDAGPPTELRSETWRIGPAVDGGFALEVAGASKDVAGKVTRGRASEVLTPDVGPHLDVRFRRFCPGPAMITIDTAYKTTGTGSGATFQYTFTSYPVLYTFTKL